MRYRSVATAAFAAAAVASSLLSTPTASAAQPGLSCNGPSATPYYCDTTTEHDGLRISYADSVPGRWGTPTVTLEGDDASTLNVKPGQTVGRYYTITVDAVLPGDPEMIYFLVEGTGQRASDDGSVHEMQYYTANEIGARPGHRCQDAGAGNLLPGESALVACDAKPNPDGSKGADPTALNIVDNSSEDFHRYGEMQGTWDLTSQPRPDVTVTAPEKAPVVTVDGEYVTEWNWNTTWSTRVYVSVTAPDTPGAEITRTPRIYVDGVQLDAPSFRITTATEPVG